MNVFSDFSVCYFTHVTHVSMSSADSESEEFHISMRTRSACDFNISSVLCCLSATGCFIQQSPITGWKTVWVQGLDIQPPPKDYLCFINFNKAQFFNGQAESESFFNYTAERRVFVLGTERCRHALLKTFFSCTFIAFNCILKNAEWNMEHAWVWLIYSSAWHFDS